MSIYNTYLVYISLSLYIILSPLTYNININIQVIKYSPYI